MQTYDEMVDSGVGIVGKIPRSWSKSKLKYITKSMISGATPTSTDDTFWSYEEGTPWVNIADITDLKGVSSTKKLLTAKGIASKNMSIQPAGSIVFSIFASLGKMGRLEIDAVTNQAIVAITPNLNRVNDQYVFYYLSFIRDYLKYYASSNTQDNINETKLKSLDVILPSVEAQQRIADFLDTETAKIDDIIAKQERLLELLEEKRRATITHAVTRGLNPSVELKETNIPWLGQIPAHWNLTMTRHLFRQVKTPVGPNSSNYKLLSLTLRGIIPRADVSGGKNPENYDTYQSVEPGDMVVCLFDYDVTPRTVGYVREPGMVTGAYTVLQPVTNLNVEYYSVFFEALDNTKELLHLCTGMRNGLSKPTFFGLSLPVPPLDEQRGIIEKINNDNEKVKELKQKIQTQITLLHERRTSLISHAVTGKVKIT